MKKIFTPPLILRSALLCALAMSGALFTACDSDDNKSDNNSGLRLQADKTDVTVGEKVTFTVTDAGTDVTSRSDIFNLTAGEELSSAEYTATKPGTFEFSAVYGNHTSNSATVNVTGLASSGDYFRKVMIHKFTGTWCSACPGMTSSLNQVETYYPDRLIIMSMHGSDDFEIEQLMTLQNNFSVTGYPTAVIDYRESSNAQVALLRTKTERSLEDYPAVCGIALTSKVESDKVVIDATVRFAQDGDYKICCVLTEDNLYRGATNGSSDGYYHHVTRAFATQALGDPLGERSQGEEYKTTFEIPVASAWTLDNCHVVVYVINQPEEGQYYINNGATCPANGSVDFAYEPAE